MMAGSPNVPLVSVIVPTYQRARLLGNCLQAIAAQRFPREQFEVVVVDDGSEVSPRDVVAQFSRSLDVRLIEQRNAGPGSARNAGARAARGAYIAFTDDDCLPDPLWLSAIAAHIEAHPGLAVGGSIINVLEEGLCSTASQMLIDFLYEYYNENADDSRFFITSNLTFPADAFRALGGFDVTFPLAGGEDRDMCDRWREHGHQLTYAPDAIVRHAHALRLLSFCRQHFNYGRGAHHLHRARSRRGTTDLKIEPSSFYARLVLYPLGKRSGVRGPVLSALMLLSQAAYGMGYLKERFRGRRPGNATTD
jgi:glycosyltransferase involved in cell wall biosynthesis